MGKGHHPYLRCHSTLFHNFKWFNIRAAIAYHPVIQKEVDELLDKGVIEPSTGGSGFCSNVFFGTQAFRWITAHTQFLVIQ